MTFLTLLGLSGFAAYMGAYVLLQLGRLDGNGIAYAAWNTAAAALVLIGLVEEFNLASALIQVAWIGIGACGVGARLIRGRSAGTQVPQQSVGSALSIDLTGSPLWLAEYYKRIGRVNDAIGAYEVLVNASDGATREEALYSLALIYQENSMVDEAHAFFALASGAVMSDGRS